MTAEPPGGVITPRLHIGCGGTVLWDLSGGFCTRCHAENLEPDDAERAADPATPYRADRFYREPPAHVADWIIEGVVKCPADCGLYFDFHGTPAELQQFISAHDCAKTAAQARYEDQA